MSCPSPRVRSRRSGFTLIELLVVVSILAVLATLVAPMVFRNVGDARSVSARAQVEMLALALQQYRLDNGEYPSSTQGLDALRTLPVSGSVPRNWRGPYLSRMVPPDPWGRAYVYVSPGVVNPGSFDLYTLGKDGKEGGTEEDADVTSWGGPVGR
ncbi:MAG: type II secretion system major pseudopilin GspG [Gemmatimonadetes bacterium]|nr:type II secretion system major pseudopilin GspG [Gemmatimonadota bacterium]